MIQEVVQSMLSKTMHLALVDFLELSHPPYDFTLQPVVTGHKCDLFVSLTLS